jgi:hypothetical protein
MSGAGVAHFKEETASNSQRMVYLLDVSNSPNRVLRVNLGGGGVDKARQLSESVKVRVSVDGVLFVDGTFVGPDTRNYFDSLKAEIEARNEMFEEITRALNGDAEAMKRIEALARGDREAIQRFGGKEHAGGQLEMKRLAGATLAIRKDLGDKAVLERINAELSKPRITLRKL